MLPQLRVSWASAGTVSYPASGTARPRRPGSQPRRGCISAPQPSRFPSSDAGPRIFIRYGGSSAPWSPQARPISSWGAACGPNAAGWPVRTRPAAYCQLITVPLVASPRDRRRTQPPRLPLRPVFRPAGWPLATPDGGRSGLLIRRSQVRILPGALLRCRFGKQNLFRGKIPAPNKGRSCDPSRKGTLHSAHGLALHNWAERNRKRPRAWRWWHDREALEIDWRCTPLAEQKRSARAAWIVAHQKRLEREAVRLFAFDGLPNRV
jgi:hypothetical protein